MTRVRRRIFIGAALVVGIIACASFAGRLQFGRSVTRQLETLDVHGAVRKYLLIVPRTVETKRLPLVVALHGTGDSAVAMSQYTELDGLASKHEFVLVYPEAQRGMWQVVGTESLANNRDIEFMDALVERLSTRFDLDPDRLYVVGMSNGATFAQLWAAQRSTQIAAVAGHSGTPPANLPSPARAFPVILVVGADDTSATVNAMVEASKDYLAFGHPVEIRVVEGLGHKWSPAENDEIWEFLSRYRRRG